MLLATDLSCRCDRALDRATALAREWKAGLTVLHAQATPDPVSEDPMWRQPPSRAELARRRILSDLRGTDGLSVEVSVERGEPASVIVDAAGRLGAEMIVTGVPRDETLVRALLGSTIDAVARKTRAPLLVAKSRPRGPYRRIVVATDFSAGSRAALEAVLGLWPEAEVTAFHSFHVAFEGFANDKMAAREAEARRALEEARTFLATIPAASRRALPVLCEHGDIGSVLSALVEEQDFDLVALGARGHSRIVDIFLGSIAQKLIMDLPTDVLVVHAARPSDPS